MNERKPTRGIAVVGTRIWLDVSSHSVVLVCNECPYQAIAFSREDAEEQCKRHWTQHSGVTGWGKNFASMQQPCRWDDNCLGVHYAKGMCSRHYRQAMYEAGLDDPTKPRCADEDCQEGAARGGLCDRHYQRARRAGLIAPRVPAPKFCTIEGCDAKHAAKGLCSKHYAQSRPKREPKREPKEPKAPRLCEIEGCSRKHAAKGMCKVHYYDAKKRASGWTPRPRQQATGLTCSVEDCEKECKSKGLCQMHYFRARRAAA